MDLQLSANGTVSECREKLNAVLAALPVPETQENKVTRMIAHHIVYDYLDPLHDAWQRKVQDARAARAPKSAGGLGGDTQDPSEPLAGFSVSLTITLGG